MVKDVVDGVERIAKDEKGNYGYGNTGCGVFKLERFLPKNTQRK